jgi:hypothetical protein
MRKQLASKVGERKKFTAVFSRLGKKAGYTGYSVETILLTKVMDAETSELVTDHLWFTFTKGFQAAALQEGNQLEFEARVKGYAKGYVNKNLSINREKRDYKLSNPTKIKRLTV